MTVQELIDKLSKADPNAKVVCYLPIDEDSEGSPLDCVGRDSFYTRQESRLGTIYPSQAELDYDLEHGCRPDVEKCVVLYPEFHF